MKLVVAVVHPVRLRAIKEALEQVEVQRITICDAQEWIQPSDFAGVRHSRALQASVRRMVTLEIAVNDDFLDRTVAAVQRVSAVFRGQLVNSGVCYVLPIERVVSFFPLREGPGAI